MLSKFLITASLLLTSLSAPVSPLEFNIVTSNVRVDTTNRFEHEKPWSERKDGQIQTLETISSNAPTLIGLQELKKNQLDDVLAGLNDNTDAEWKYYGVGRDDGKEAGEYAAIIYDAKTWKLVNGTTKWLSETPDVPSKSWGANNIRIVTITELKHKSSGYHINYLNTHYDHKSELARQHSSELIAKWASEIPNDYQTFVSGDFNSQSNDESYQTLVKYMDDTRQIAQIKYSQIATYTGFEPSDEESTIDFIWVPKGSNQYGAKTTVIDYNVFDTWTPQGFRFSDHRPVVSRIKIDA